MPSQSARIALLSLVLAGALVPRAAAQMSRENIDPGDPQGIPESRQTANLPQGMAEGRVFRELTRSEILQAIHAALGRQGFVDMENLRLEDLKLQTVVRVTQEDAGLQVKKIEFDPVRGETRFRLWTSTEPHLLPFQVMANWHPLVPVLVAQRDLGPRDVVSGADFRLERRMATPWLGQPALTPEELAGHRARRRIRAGEVVTREMFQATALAVPGKPAKLVVERRNLRILITVVPLQPGFKGQCIRVRDLATHRIMKAEVVAAGLLRATY